MPSYRNLGRRGLFSLLELLVVLIALGVVATIVGPRISRAAHAPPDTSQQLLVGNLRALRSAIDAYAADHANRFPHGDVTQITAQLTQYSDRKGNVSPTRTAQYRFGPYLREIPPISIGANKGRATLQLPSQYLQQAWLYNPATGQISPNTSPGECDPAGRPYNTY
jgi:type II secretory pathway pseudopilin PulG